MFEIAAEVMLRNMVMAKICVMTEVDVLVEFVQGRCSSD